MNFQEVLSILSAKEEISIVSDIKLDEPVTFTVHYETPEDLLIYLSSLAGGDYVREGNLYKIIKKIENLQVIKTSLPDDRLRDVFPEIKRFNNYLISRTEYDLKSDIEKLEKFSMKYCKLIIVKTTKSFSKIMDLQIQENLNLGGFTSDVETKLSYLFSLQASFNSQEVHSDIIDFQEVLMRCSTAKPLSIFFGSEEIREVFSLEGENATEKRTAFERIKTGLKLDFKFFEKEGSFYTDFEVKDNSSVTQNLKNSFDYSNYIELKDNEVIELIRFKTKKVINRDDYFLFFIPTGTSEFEQEIVTRFYITTNLTKEFFPKSN